MIFLYNRERVVKEGLALVKCKVAKRLGLSIDKISGGFILKGGTLTPEFNIDENLIEGREGVSDIIIEEWNKVLTVVNERLSTL